MIPYLVQRAKFSNNETKNGIDKIFMTCSGDEVGEIGLDRFCATPLPNVYD